MCAQEPEIAEAADRIPVVVELGDLVGFVFTAVRPLAFDQQVDLARLKAGDLDIEIQVDLGEMLELDGEKLFIPAGELGQPVVGQDIGPLLGFGQVVEPNGLPAPGRVPWPPRLVHGRR